MIGIYKITNADNESYIGKSKDVFSRFYNYKVSNGKGQPDLHESFLKFGVENHKFEIICECEQNDLRSFEAFFIKKYDSIKNGLNRNGNYYLPNDGKEPKEISINYSINLLDEPKKRIVNNPGRKKIDGKTRQIKCTDHEFEQVKIFLRKFRYKEAKQNK